MRRTHLILARTFVLVSSLAAFFVSPRPSGGFEHTPAPVLATTPSVLLATGEPAVIEPSAVRQARPQCRVLLQTAFEHGWPEATLAELERVLWRESRCTTDAVNVNRNGTVDRGAMQINDVNVPHLRDTGVIAHHDDLFDPVSNLKAGLSLYRLAGGFCPWRAPAYCS